MITSRAFLLHEHPSKYTYLKSYQVEALDEEPATHLRQPALEHIKSHRNFREVKSLEVDEPKIYLCSKPVEGKSQQERRKQAVAIANRGELETESFALLLEDDVFEEKTHRDLIIVFKTLHSSFAIFEQKSRSSYDDFGSGSVMTFPEDSVQTIYDTARSLITRLLDAEDPQTVATIDNLTLHELKDGYQERYKAVLKTGRLEPDLLGRSSSVFRDAESRLRDITSNLIFVFAATRNRPLRIPYALFYRESGSYKYVSQNHVEASSEDTVGFLHEVVRTHIEAIPPYDGETRHKIIVYEPKGAFESAYDKQPKELESLRLEGGSFSKDRCSVLLPWSKLSDWRVGQALIIVFGIPVQPQPSSVSGTSILDMLRNLHIAEKAPSVAAKLENYAESQKDAEKRILDDRPGKDELIAPIPLLFQPFGYFRDIRCGVEVPGEGDIHEGELRRKVDTLADAMTKFPKSEEKRRSKFIEHLEYIFGLPPGSINSSKILGGQTISDGHVNGAHGIMVFCMECKNELSAASCEPTAQLVSYIANSLQSQVDNQSELLKRWRVPVLGATLIGPNVQFFGVVWVGQMRVVPLTPPLPMVNPTGEEFRWDLFLAFKAAFIVFSKIRTDVDDFLKVLKGPSAGWPPVMATKKYRYPSVTEIDAEVGAFPNSRLKKIQFVLESRHDEVDHRHLYRARLDSPISSDKPIYVKFSQRYSLDLHRFCASRGLAPRILGFQQLSGGWFVVAMEKIDIVNPASITSFPEVEKWKTDIRTLVDEFHQKDLVHGDLRLANFVFTENENPRRMLLVDFDWGGKEGEAVFPHELLNPELGVPNDKLRDRKIEKKYDRDCLLTVFEWLDVMCSTGTSCPDKD